MMFQSTLSSINANVSSCDHRVDNLDSRVKVVFDTMDQNKAKFATHLEELKKSKGK